MFFILYTKIKYMRNKITIFKEKVRKIIHKSNNKDMK